LLSDGGIGEVNSADTIVNDGVVISELSTAHSAEPQSDATSDGSRGETNVGESPIAYIQRRIREIVAKLREPERPP